MKFSPRLNIFMMSLSYILQYTNSFIFQEKGTIKKKIFRYYILCMCVSVCSEKRMGFYRHGGNTYYYIPSMHRSDCDYCDMPMSYDYWDKSLHQVSSL